MAKSKYQQELEDFKASLPDIIITTANDHGITLCNDGLTDLFERLGVKWEHPREECVVTLNLRMNLPVNPDAWGYTSYVSDDADDDLDMIAMAIDKALSKATEHFISGSVEIDEAFAR